MTVPTLSEPGVQSITPRRHRQTWAFVAAGILAAVYLVISILIARHRLFWFEEIVTVIYSVQPTFAGMWRVFTIGADGIPPGNYLVTRLFTHLPLALEVSARLPSALAVAAGLLVTFDCARRLTDGVHGLIAVAFLTCSALPYYGYEARPYALFALLSAVALWLWMNTSDETPASAFLIGGVFFLATWVHYYAIFWLAPYTLWEFVNRSTRRTPSRKLIAAYVGVVCALASLAREILAQYRSLAHGFWSPPTVRALAATFNDLFPHALFPIVGILGVAALLRVKRENLVRPMPPFEQLCWFFALLPLVGFVFGKIATHAFLNRYFIGLLPAFAIALACLIWRHVPNSPLVALAAVVLFAGFGLGDALEHLRYSSAVHPLTATHETERMASMLALESRTPPDRSIVLRPGDLLSLETHYYASHPERIVFLLGPGESAPDPQAPLSTGENRPIRHWTVEELRTHARGAMLIDPTQETIDALARAGYRISEHYDGVLEIVSVE